MRTATIGRTAGLACLVSLVVWTWGGLAAQAAEYGTPRALNVGDVYRLDPDGYTGDEHTAEPKADANDGSCIAAGECDNPYFQRTNVTSAHDSGSCLYWYTSDAAHTLAGEPDPNGPQYVEYRPPLNILNPGRYRINAQYRRLTSRATYAAEYIVSHAGGTTTITQVQYGTDGACATFDLGAFDLGSTGYVRVNDPGGGSITFDRMKFTYLGPSGMPNTAPAPNAGPDQNIILPASAALAGSVTDDGLPDPPASVTTTWSMISGPGTVTFGNASALNTTATFSVAGTYVLRLTANDSDLQATDDATITVQPAGSQLIYSTQYEFDADPSTAGGVVDASTGDANGNGLLTKVGTGTGDSGSGIANGVLHFIDSTSSGNNGFYFAQAVASDLTYTIDMRVKVNAGVGPAGNRARRSMGYSAGPNKNLGLRLTKAGDVSPSACTAGSVVWVGTSGGLSEGCVDMSSVFRRIRISVNASTNTLKIFDLDGGTQLASATGAANGTSYAWATEINGKGGYHIGSISGGNTTSTDYELDYFRVLLGTAVEDATTPIQSLVTCDSSVTPFEPQTAAAQLPAGAVPGQIPFTINNSGNSAMTYTAVETGQEGDAHDYSWLSLDKAGGTVSAGGTDTVTATINAASLAPGAYTAYIKVTDGCNPANIYIREIDLAVYNCQFDVAPGCNVIRSYLLDYPAALPAGQTFTVNNPAAQALGYSVAEVDQNGIPIDYTWLSLSKTSGTAPASGTDSVNATINPLGLAAGTYTAYLRFTSTSCAAPPITRTITLTVVGAGVVKVYEYLGDADPLTKGFGLKPETPACVSQGSVEVDPLAGDGKAWRIQDTGGAKTKYVTTPAPAMSGGVGVTVVSRLRVRSATSPLMGGLFIWENPNLSTEIHWGGPTGLIHEPNRGGQFDVTLTDPLQANDAYHVIRVTASGPDDCNRLVRVFFDENPTAVMQIVNASALANTPEGIGFGAGSTAGTYDIAFDWVTGTNAGAFAPGEETAVIGRSLIPAVCQDPFADFDEDGDVDQDDFGILQNCYTGGGGTLDLNNINCKCADRDADNDVDELDVGRFVDCVSGPTIPANQACDN